jgi:hypothetical protein
LHGCSGKGRSLQGEPAEVMKNIKSIAWRVPSVRVE